MRELIEKYALLPHPEGGYYREIHRSAQAVHSTAISSERQALTHIYFLLTRGQFSRFHRVRHDEIWNFYEGSPLRLITFDGRKIAENLLGPDTAYTGVITGGHYQAAETTGDYSLVGCTVAPGFEFEDFSFLTDIPKDLQLFTDHAPGYCRFL